MARNSTEKIKDVIKLSSDIYCLRIESPVLAKKSKCGQFVTIKCSDGLDLSLRRPISICDVNKDDNTVDIVFQVRGKGTKLLSEMKSGDFIDIIGPLGTNTFTINNFSRIAVVGGGIGIFPLLYLLKSLKGKCEKRIAILGFRNKNAIVLENEFNAASDELLIATDDGSYGYKGFTTDLLEKEMEQGLDMIYACGPLPMLKKVAAIARKNGVPCEVSMEERMGCGIGACFVCACKLKDPDASEGWDYKQVCKNGPVFNSEEVIFDD